MLTYFLVFVKKNREPEVLILQGFTDNRPTPYFKRTYRTSLISVINTYTGNYINRRAENYENVSRPNGRKAKEMG